MTVRNATTTTVNAGYGTLLNPGVVKAPKSVLQVLGPADAPTGLVLRGKHRFAKGAILSAAPGGPFPKGLLAHVTSASFTAGKTTVRLRSASIYEVAPNMTFDVPLKVSEGARSSEAKCEKASGVEPYRRIKVARVSGGWNTVSVFGKHVTVGVRLNLAFTAEAGVDITRAVGFSCSLSATAVYLQGAIGPVPVYGAIGGDLHAGVSVGAKMNAGGSVNVNAGASSVGLPPAMVWVPNVSFSSPKFTISVEAIAQATAGIGINGELGVGVRDAANLHIRLDNTLDFAARPGKCTWDLDLGQFSAGGKLLGWTISTPKTPPIYHKNLWHNGCGAPPPSPSPSPGPGGGGPGPGGGGPGPGGGGPGPGGGAPPPPPPPPPSSPSISAYRGGTYGCGSCRTLDIQVHNFPTGTYTYYCHDNSGPGGSDVIFYQHAVTVTDPNQGTWPGVFCYNSAPFVTYLVMNGVRSNSVQF